MQVTATAEHCSAHFAWHKVPVPSQRSLQGERTLRQQLQQASSRIMSGFNQQKYVDAALHAAHTQHNSQWSACGNVTQQSNVIVTSKSHSE